MGKYITLIIVCVLLVFWFFPNEEKRIHALLDSLEENTSYEEQPPVFERLARAQNIMSMLHDDVKITVLFDDESTKEFSGNRGLKDKLLAAFQYLGKVASACKEREIEIHADSATVQCKAIVLGQEQGRDDIFQEQHDIELELVKHEGGWRITHARNTTPIADYAS